MRFLRRLQRIEGTPLLKKQTEMVIEGYFRCANTFAVYAFLSAQPSWIITAHHTHSPATIHQAVKWHKPILILIREPVGTILSHMLKHPGLSLQIRFRDYVNYYTRIKPYHENYVVATFEQVITDFGCVIKRVNQRFGTNFWLFEHTEENVNQILRTIESADSQIERGASIKYSLPLTEKEIVKSRLKHQLDDPGLNLITEEAQEIFQYFKALS